MERPNYLEKIKIRIRSSNKGSVFVPSDFFDIADALTVNMSLSRLSTSHLVRRVMRGVYEYPEYNDFLGEYIAPSPDKVAHALARNYGWTIVPCGDTALNLLGLSTQVPASWSYFCDGTYKKYKLAGFDIEFKHRTNRDISKTSPKTALVIHAIKALGKDHVDEKIISTLAKTLSKDEKSAMLLEAKYATAWIYEIIKEICKK